MADEPIQIYNNGDMMRDFTYIDDIVTGVENILGNPPGKDKNGAGPAGCWARCPAISAESWTM